MQLPAARSKTILSNKNAGFVRTAARLLFRIACVAALLIALYPLKLQAQEPTPDDDEVVKVNTDLLVYPIRVRDKRKPAASSLAERDLTLKDDDHVTTGLYLYPGADRVTLVFALDESGSLREIVSQQREAALGLFGRFGKRSSVAVMRFAEQPQLVAPFGRDTTTAGEAFSFPVKPNQHTAIFDAAAAAVRAFDTLPRFRSERRIVILISDGLDNASTTKAGAAIRAALEKQISFYVIHLPLFAPLDGHLAVRPPSKGFRDLAEKTGGKYFLVGDASSALSLSENRVSNDLAPIFFAIEEDLRSQYLLGFYAGEASRDGRNHRLKVRLPAGVEYQVGSYGYSQTHEFSVKLSALKAIK
jgi:Ca-activated chloride channel family protein